ncbi:hypothetical protein AS144_01260 [Francisella endosymbiont of Amblyomma maculatum]|nr:hypothetical protein AS144_01260 [Francisella endosymbiont of Amblyomma maculatum]
MLLEILLNITQYNSTINGYSHIFFISSLLAGKPSSMAFFNAYLSPILIIVCRAVAKSCLSWFNTGVRVPN